MKLDYIPEPDEYSIAYGAMLNDSKITEVSGYTAGVVYNELCRMIGGRFPDAKLEESAPAAHDFFMKLFGNIPNE